MTMVKTSAHRTKKQMGVENDDLRTRLAEAEENLRTLRSNGRDVISVSGAGSVLQQSELRYRRLFETAQDGILILDAETGMIDDVNPYLIKMLGYSREEFIRRRLWEVGAFRDIDASQEAFEALQANEYIRYEDLPLRAKNGRLIEVEFVSNVYPGGRQKSDPVQYPRHHRPQTERGGLAAKREAFQRSFREYEERLCVLPDCF